ncbi:unnamed protein product [Adineta steineri]|uniref:Uncharacterized protein n=1 Tax=Adineta steineri TaxID=433720 RepID=A0A815A6Z2_9BILA|nr:unnamed protein product [Adineta steineri]CAF1340755.1 unnamed protein product [Adineta steineri]
MADYLCKDCQCGICEECSAKHQEKELCQHKSTSIKQRSDSYEDLSCKKHKNDTSTAIDDVASETVKDLRNLFGKAQEEFAASNTYTRPACSGRACANCGKCRDWYYTGDQEIWKWITNVKNWNENERKRWDDGKYSECFTKREGSTCRGRFDYYYDRDHVYHGGHIDFGYTYSCRDCGAPALYRDGDCCGSGTRVSYISEVYSYCQCLNNIKKK